MKKPELLAPAGSVETLKAVIKAGADAVYIGGPRFGARAYADNPGEEDLCAAIDYAHLHGARVHLTVNTLVKEREMEALVPYLAPYYECGLDAVLVQDLGVLSVIRRNFPDLAIHASTQMSVTGIAGIRYLEKMGVSRVVLAREVSLPEIRAIRKETGMEIEVFAHGALCVSCSGRCLMSSFLGGRSGNRGRCAQPCRLPYDLIENGKRVGPEQAHFLLSPKDLNSLPLLSEMMEAGVDSLKIEGRMKKLSYAAGVVSVYRKYIDAYADQKEVRIDPKDQEDLFSLFNRDGFTDGYLTGKRDHMLAAENRKMTAREGGMSEAVHQKMRDRFGDGADAVPMTGEAIFKIGKPSSLTLYAEGTASYTEGPVPEAAKGAPMDGNRIRKQLEKTGGSEFAFRELSVDADEGIFLPVGALNEFRRRALSDLRENLLAPYRRQAAGAEEELRGICEKNDKKPGNAPVYEASVSTEEQFAAVLADPHIQRVIAEPSFLLADAQGGGKEDGKAAFYTEGETSSFAGKVFAERCREKGREPVCAMPYITKHDHKEIDALIEVCRMEKIGKILARDLEALTYLSEKAEREELIADTSVYTMNREAQKMVAALTSEDTVPLELTKHEIRERKNAESTMIVYGRVPLMITRICPHKEMNACTKDSGLSFLRDRKGTEFPLKRECRFCYSIVYNSVPVFLGRDLEEVLTLGVKRLRLSFTVESGEETKAVLQAFSGKNTEMPYTKGHFIHGVE